MNIYYHFELFSVIVGIKFIENEKHSAIDSAWYDGA